MKKYLITIQYLGKKYCGFQRQDNGLSIQQVLEDTMSKALNEKVELFASGRTDAGVNAYAQTAHFETNTVIPPEKLPFAVNQFLPSDIKILSCKEVPMEFHARFDVKKKIYEYNIYFGPTAMPILDLTSYWIKKQPNIKLMKECAKMLEGKHNFKAFVSAGSETKNFERILYYVDVTQSGNQIKIEVCGNGFMYNMVRIIVGTLLEVGDKKKTIDDIKLAMEKQDRSLAGYLVPPKGLFLKEVRY